MNQNPYIEVARCSSVLGRLYLLLTICSLRKLGAVTTYRIVVYYPLDIPILGSAAVRKSDRTENKTGKTLDG